jgi:hypothetical protein
VKARAGYFKTLADKLGARLGDGDPVLVATREAHEKAHVLWIRLHYLSMEAFSREFDAEERQAKMKRRFRPKTRYNTPMKYSLRSLMTFSIRDLFWLVLVVAMGLGWWLERGRASTCKAEAKQLQADLSIAKEEIASSSDLLTKLIEELKVRSPASQPKSSAPVPNPPKR